MGFSGIRAVILVAVFVVLLLGITRFDLPGWILPVGLIAAGVALKAWEKSASSSRRSRMAFGYAWLDTSASQRAVRSS